MRELARASVDVRDQVVRTGVERRPPAGEVRAALERRLRGRRHRLIRSTRDEGHLLAGKLRVECAGETTELVVGQHLRGEDLPADLLLARLVGVVVREAGPDPLVVPVEVRLLHPRLQGRDLRAQIGALGPPPFRLRRELLAAADQGVPHLRRGAKCCCAVFRRHRRLFSTDGAGVGDLTGEHVDEAPRLDRLHYGPAEADLHEPRHRLPRLRPLRLVPL
ncbi:hypothetical protein DOU12_06180 [Clavibacter michiganensis subsp. michiganensis]|nr:hypothetical protein [Clavibacter michiganensis subsp. michiganensis]